MDKTAYEHTVGCVLQKNSAWYDDALEGLKKHYGENKELYHNTAIGAGGGGLLGLLMGGWKGGLGGAIAGGTAANLGTRWYDKYKADNAERKALAEENARLEETDKENTQMMQQADAAQAAEEAAKPKGPGMARRWYDATRAAGQKAYQQSKDQQQADALLAQVKSKEGPATAKVRALFDEHLKNQREGGMAGAFVRNVQQGYNNRQQNIPIGPAKILPENVYRALENRARNLGITVNFRDLNEEGLREAVALMDQAERGASSPWYNTITDLFRARPKLAPQK